MDATSDLVREQLTDELKETLALQEAQLGRHTLYSITARHHRVEPYETDWRGKQCQSVRVTLPEKKGARDKIWTRLGVVKSEDHLLFSAQEVVERYEAAFGRTPRVGRVDLITGARHLNVSRFSPISIVLAYADAEDEVPAFYFLESGSAQGGPAALYYASEMGAEILAKADFKFSAMACAGNWYKGGLKMDARGVEPTQVYADVAQEKDGSRTYLHLRADYTVDDVNIVTWPLSAQLEAALRVFAIARGMGEDLLKEDLQDILAEFALRVFDWDIKPPETGTAEGYFGCPPDAPGDGQ